MLATLAALLVTFVVSLVPAGAAEGGGVAPFGGAPSHGSSRGVQIGGRIIGLAASPTGNGYWQVASDGGVFAFGDAPFTGSAGGTRLSRPVVGMTPTSTGRGYWLVASDGGIFSFGDARFWGSTGDIALNRPIVGMASTPTGRGYWLVASDGGIFSFGDAQFRGSAGGTRLAGPVVAMAATPTGRGYWLVAADGGVFAYGDAPPVGSAAGSVPGDPVVSLSPTPTGRGYLLATAFGRVLAFGDARASGGLESTCTDQPVIAVASRRTGGYWLGTSTLLPPFVPPGTHPLDALAAESAHLAAGLRLRQGCQGTAPPQRGRLTHPLPGGRVTSSYGERIHPVYGRRQFHAGTDFAGPSTILSAGAGTVVEVANRTGYGLTTVIDHGDGIGTVYAHQARADVRPGQRVARGQAIGVVGSSGFSTGPHLHVEVRVKGAPTDPLQWF